MNLVLATVLLILATILLSYLIAELWLLSDFYWHCDNYCDRHRLLYKVDWLGRKCYCGFLHPNGTIEWSEVKIGG